jgi:hypothetical protein
MAQGTRQPRSQGSNSFRDTEGSDGDYLMMEELDEENINWGKLLTRAFCLLLLVIIIGCVSPYTEGDKMISLLSSRHEGI